MTGVVDTALAGGGTGPGGEASAGHLLREARERRIPTVVVIDTEAVSGPGAGGDWWDVAVPEVSARPEVRAAREEYEAAVQRQRLGD